MVLPMNTGVEAVETSIKLARKWAYLKKQGVKEGEAIVFSVEGNFHGRSLGVIRFVSSPVGIASCSRWGPPQYEHGSGEPGRLWALPSERRPYLP